MLPYITIIWILETICSGIWISREKKHKLSEKAVDIVESIISVIWGLSLMIGIALLILHTAFENCPFCTIVSSQDTDYSIISFSETVTLTDKNYIIKVDDNTNITYILSDSESNIEVDYQGDTPATMTITQMTIFDYCTFETTEEKIYKIH